MAPHGLLELRHEAEVRPGDDRQLLRRRPLAVGLGDLPERLTRLGVDRPVGDHELGVELRPALQYEGVDGASEHQRGRIGRLDLPGHLALVEARCLAEVAQKVAGEVLAVPCGLVVFVGVDVNEIGVFAHVCVSFRFRGAFGSPHNYSPNFPFWLKIFFVEPFFHLFRREKAAFTRLPPDAL